jgi:DNA-binding NtrC family response regulator
MGNASVRRVNDQGSAFAAAGISPEPGKYFTRMMSILIVDDEPLIRWSLGQSLAARGYNVVEAASAREALERLSERRDIAVVLLDLKLPDSKDLSLLRTLQRRAGAPRIVLMTAHGSAEVLREAMEAGAFRAVSKPFDLDQMVEIVQDAIVA